MIKKIFVSIALCILSASSHAVVERCGKLQAIAESVMFVRQSGVSANDLLRNTSTDSKLLFGIVISAYDFPVYDQQELKEKVAKEFGNAYFVKCLKVSSELK